MPHPGRFVLICFLLLLGPSAVAAADQVWFETRVAEISVGYDATTNQTLQRAFFLAFVGPQSLVFVGPKLHIRYPDIVRNCAAETVRPVRDQLLAALQQKSLERKQNAQLAHASDPGSSGASSIDVSTAASAELADTSTALAQATYQQPVSFFSCLKKYKATAVVLDNFFLSLVQRDCDRDTCKLSGTAQRLANDPDAPVFESLYNWTSNKSAIEQRGATNKQFRLAVTQTNNDQSFRLSADFQPIKEINIWKTEASEHVLAMEQEALIDKIRDDKKRDPVANGPENAMKYKLSYAAALVVDASKTDVSRGADVYSNPIRAFIAARASGDPIFGQISDEIARTRLVECRMYRGKTAIANIASCAGYKNDQVAVLDCLSGLKCAPQLADVASTTSILLGQPLTLKGLADSAELPRYATSTFGALKQIYDACTSQGASDNGAQKCLMAKTIGADPRTSQIYNCLGTTSTDKERSMCAIQAVSPGSAPLVACASRDTSQGQATCVISNLLPVNVKTAYDCYAGAQGHGAELACLGPVVGGNVGRIAACSASGGTKLALVACVAGGAIPPDAVAAISCVEQNENPAAIGGCVIAAKLPPQIAMQIGCVVQSDGDPYGTGICLVSNSTNLTPNEQLALQCLMSTGGEPDSFAACVAGHLTLQELAKCKGKNIGEGDCFGQNNEIQKLAVLLTGSPISSNSVLGQYVDVNLKTTEYAMNVVQPILTVGQDQIAQTITQTQNDLQGAAQGNVQSIAHLAIAPIAAPVQAAVDDAKKFISSCCHW